MVNICLLKSLSCFQKIPVQSRKTTPRPHKLEYVVEDHYITTAPPEMFKPFRMGEEHPFESIKEADKDILRTIDDSQLFQEFLSTMFGSEEEKEYADQDDDAPGENMAIAVEQLQESDTKPTAANVVEPELDAKTTTGPEGEPEVVQEVEQEVDQDAEQDEAELEPDPEPEPDVALPLVTSAHALVKHAKAPEKEVRMVTTIEKFEFIAGSQEATTPALPDDLKKYTALNDNEYERKVEQKIAKLIDDIDIKDLLKSDSNETRLLEAAEKIEKETLVELNESEYSDSSDYVGPGGLNGTGKGQDEGLSIPIMPVKDLTFRQNYTEKAAVKRIINQVYPVPDRDQKHLFTKGYQHKVFPKTKHYVALKHKT